MEKEEVVMVMDVMVVMEITEVMEPVVVMQDSVEVDEEAGIKLHHVMHSTPLDLFQHLLTLFLLVVIMEERVVMGVMVVVTEVVLDSVEEVGSVEAEEMVKGKVVEMVVETGAETGEVGMEEVTVVEKAGAVMVEGIDK
jgi:hypothetical protein